MNKIKLKLDKYALVLRIAAKAILENKVRSLLTALGIIFGVAAVISMLAIGNGAKKEVLDQMKLVGVNNIVITPRLIRPSENAAASEDNNQQDDLAKVRILGSEKKRICDIIKDSEFITNCEFALFQNTAMEFDYFFSFQNTWYNVKLQPNKYGC